MDPFPQDAHADLSGSHVLHQIQDVLVGEEIGGLQRRRLKSLTKGVPVL